MIYIITILYVIIKGEILFYLLMISLSSICLLEFLFFSKISEKDIKLIMIFFILSIFIQFIAKINSKNLISTLFIFPFSYCMFKLLSNESSIEKINHISQVFFGWIYIEIPFFLARNLYIFKKENFFIIGLFILIWTNDTLAYLIGSKFGKRKLAAFISPNKTIEGFLGGMFFCLICSFIFYNILEEKYWLIIGIIVVIFGTLGDLVESSIKRAYNIKNSSQLFLGHGGFLDRLDSFLLIIPIVFLYLTFF